MQKKPASAPVFVPKASVKTDASPFPTSAIPELAVNFVAIANPDNTFSSSTTVTSGQINSDMTTLREGTGVSACYIPTTTFPEIDRNGTGDWGKWNRELITPTPIPYGPSILPPPNSPTYPTVNFQPQPQYWGVRFSKTKYIVVKPEDMSLADAVGAIVARCLNKKEAQVVADAFNKANGPVVVPANSCTSCGGNVEYIIDKDGKASIGPKKSCTCDGVSSICSECAVTPRKAKLKKPGPDPVYYDHFKNIVKNLEGRLLTILDAAIAGEPQNKALKSLVKREVRSTIQNTYQFCHRDLDAGDNCDDGNDSDEAFD